METWMKSTLVEMWMNDELHYCNACGDYLDTKKMWEEHNCADTMGE